MTKCLLRRYERESVWPKASLAHPLHYYAQRSTYVMVQFPLRVGSKGEP